MQEKKISELKFEENYCNYNNRINSLAYNSDLSLMKVVIRGRSYFYYCDYKLYLQFCDIDFVNKMYFYMSDVKGHLQEERYDIGVRVKIWKSIGLNCKEYWDNYGEVIKLGNNGLTIKLDNWSNPILVEHKHLSKV